MTGGVKGADVGGDGRMGETVLDSGLRVLTEEIPGVRSVSVGVWVRQGSAHEEGRLLGASHLLEHMVFKGTERRSAREIALSLESLGGSLDAYTSREHTSFQSRVLDEHMPRAMDVLADLVRNPALRAADLDLEREVVLEEIAQVEDQPDDLVFELHSRALWPDHPYGHSILGTRKTVAGMDAERLRELHRLRYEPGNVLVAAAGRLDHEAVVEMAEDHFGGWTGVAEARPEIPEPGKPPEGRVRQVRPGSQSHLIYGVRGPARAHPDRYPLILVSQALGGGMSSRLFQRIREEMGLAYSVFSFQSFYGKGGMTGVYVGTRPEWAARAAGAVEDELRQVRDHGLSADELAETKAQVKGQVMLSLESTGARMYRLAGFAIHDEPFLSLDELLERIDRVTPDDVRRVSERYFEPEEQLVVELGPER